MKKYNHKIILIPLIFVSFIFNSCQDGRWYPSADVVVENHYEHITQTDTKQAILTFTIHNTSKTSILASAITFKVTTNQREYLQTVSSNVRIIPDGLIALSTTITYLDNSENFVRVSIVNTFFE